MNIVFVFMAVMLYIMYRMQKYIYPLARRMPFHALLVPVEHFQVDQEIVFNRRLAYTYAELICFGSSQGGSNSFCRAPQDHFDPEPCVSGIGMDGWMMEQHWPRRLTICKMTSGIIFRGWNMYRTTSRASMATTND
jgi:hypothetical protein